MTAGSCPYPPLFCPIPLQKGDNFFWPPRKLHTVVLGLILFICQPIPFLSTGDSIGVIILNIILLAIPYYYLHNAYKNFKA
ncbi:MAG: hypothetical protein Q4C56_00295 [Peptococcaceae bacterium]|nr:hypothetical protein [Peptococcaceae bacterium]